MPEATMAAAVKTAPAFCSATPDGLIMGLFVSIICGALFCYLVITCLRWLADLPNPRLIPTAAAKPHTPRERQWAALKLEGFSVLIGVIERGVITTLATFDLSSAGTFATIWMGLKLASNWNRRSLGGSATPAQWAELARNSLTSLTGSLVSVAFAFAGALMICGRMRLLG